MGNFTEFEEVPKSRASLLLVCWLADYFDLVGEEQRGSSVVHYDPIPLKEIWEQYKVNNLNNIDCIILLWFMNFILYIFYRTIKLSTTSKVI